MAPSDFASDLDWVFVWGAEHGRADAARLTRHQTLANLRTDGFGVVWAVRPPLEPHLLGGQRLRDRGSLSFAAWQAWGVPWRTFVIPAAVPGQTARVAADNARHLVTLADDAVGTGRASAWAPAAVSIAGRRFHAVAVTERALAMDIARAVDAPALIWAADDAGHVAPDRKGFARWIEGPNLSVLTRDGAVVTQVSAPATFQVERRAPAGGLGSAGQKPIEPTTARTPAAQADGG